MINCTLYVSAVYILAVACGIVRGFIFGVPKNGAEDTSMWLQQTYFRKKGESVIGNTIPFTFEGYNIFVGTNSGLSQIHLNHSRFFNFKEDVSLGLFYNRISTPIILDVQESLLFILNKLSAGVCPFSSHSGSALYQIP